MNELSTVFAAFAQSATLWPDNDFLQVVPATAATYGIEARCHSYSDIYGEVLTWAQAYSEAGYGHGHRVGLMLENRPEFFVHWFALNAVGASVVPLNAEWRAGEIEYVLEHSEVCHVLALDSRLELVRRAVQATGRDVSISGSRMAHCGRPASPPPLGDGPPGTASECALLYTSGTTGRPKGCVLSNEYFLFAGAWYATSGGLSEITPGKERLITPLPLVHMNAMAYSAMVMLASGGCLVQLDRFHPGSWWESVRASGATICHYLGVMPAMLMSRPSDPADRDHALRFGLGSGVAPEQHAGFEERFGFALLEGWAMTETGAGAIIFANHHPRHVGTACFGRAEPRLEWRVVDDAGSDVAAGLPGELLVRGAGTAQRFGFFSHYLKDQAASDEAWRGGWFHTGDLVRVDAEGNFFFVDRKKNIIRRSGENISAVEVESVLLTHPAVRTAGVTALPDALRGDEVIACVVTQSPLETPEQREALAREMVALCLNRLAYYKAPGFIAFCERLPLTPTQKLQRMELKAFALDCHAAGRCVDLRALKVRQD